MDFIASNASNGSFVSAGEISTSNFLDLQVVVPLMISCVVAIASNTFVCYLILTVHRLKTPTNVFTFSLCVCNISVAGVLLPMHCFFMGTLAYQFIVLITVLTYIGNLTAVTHERLFSITNPFRYRAKMTKSRALKITIIAWIVPMIYCILPVLWGSNTTALVHKIYIIGTLVIFLVLPLIFIFFVYVKVCFEIKKMYEYYQSIAIDKMEKKGRNLRKHTQMLRFFKKNIRKKCVTCTCLRGNSQEIVAETNRMESQARVIYAVESNEHKSTEWSTEKESKEEISAPVETSETYVTLLSISRVGGASTGRETPENSQTERKSISWEPLNDMSGATEEHVSSCDNSGKKSNARRSSLGRLKQRMNELKASLAFAAVAMTYMFTWVPVIVLTFLDVLDRMQLAPPSLFVFSIYAIAINSLLDPFLYGLLLRNFRMTIAKIFKKHGHWLCCQKVNFHHSDCN